MSEELRELKYPGRKKDVLFFLSNIIGRGDLTIDDIRVLCSHAPGEYSLNVDSLVPYCAFFGWISTDERISISDDIESTIQDLEGLNYNLVRDTVSALFQEEALSPEMFLFDAMECCYRFRSERFPLALSGIRNALISQGFFEVNREKDPAVFYVGSQYESLVSGYCKHHRERMTLEQLRKKLEANAVAGERAEEFVLGFEKRRLGNERSQQVRIISDIDVAAGYDIVSFHTDASEIYDRFIEVKAVSNDVSFFWSENEYDIAKLKGNDYYLYLVDLGSIEDPSYAPIMIPDPAKNIMTSPEWLVEPQSYRIRKI